MELGIGIPTVSMSIPVVGIPDRWREFPVPELGESVGWTLSRRRIREAGPAEEARFWAISLYFPRRSGISTPETSSLQTASTAIQSAAAETRRARCGAPREISAIPRGLGCRALAHPNRRLRVRGREVGADRVRLRCQIGRFGFARDSPTSEPRDDTAETIAGPLDGVRNEADRKQGGGLLESEPKRERDGRTIGQQRLIQQEPPRRERLHGFRRWRAGGDGRARGRADPDRGDRGSARAGARHRPGGRVPDRGQRVARTVAPLAAKCRGRLSCGFDPQAQ